MANAVVVLGAGASADFGVPTLGTIFQDVYVQRYLENHPHFANLLHDVFWEPRGHDINTAHESINVEDMLTILRDWEEEEDAPNPPDALQVERTRKHLYLLIERAVHRGKSSNNGRHLNPFIRYCRNNYDRTTWASFNWDCMFEASYWYSSDHRPPQMGGHRENPRLAIDVGRWQGGQSSVDFERGHELLKLHGSVSWWLVPIEVPEERKVIRSYRFGNDVRDKFDEYEETQDPAERPVILEPSFHKYDDIRYTEYLAPQWQRLLIRLSEADVVIIIGYSLPPADSLARSKFLTGFQINPEAQWLVVNPDPEVLARYRRLFGRERLIGREETLAEFNDHLGESLDEILPG